MNKAAKQSEINLDYYHASKTIIRLLEGTSMMHKHKWVRVSIKGVCECEGCWVCDTVETGHLMYLTH